MLSNCPSPGNASTFSWDYLRHFNLNLEIREAFAPFTGQKETPSTIPFYDDLRSSLKSQVPTPIRSTSAPSLPGWILTEDTKDTNIYM